MNPAEFSWTEDQQVTVSNPTARPFKFMVHGKAYEVGAGKTVKMPGYIAWIYVYNQAVAAAQADSKFASWNDEGFKQQYFERFVVGVDAVIQQVQEVEPEVNTFEELPVQESEEVSDAVDPEPNSGGNYVSKYEKKANAKSKV